MDVTEKLLKWLQELVRIRGETSAGLARTTAMSQSAWHRLLKGDTKWIKTPMIEALCAWANITQEDLLAISRGQYRELDSKLMTVREAGPADDVTKELKERFDLISAWEPVKQKQVAEMLRIWTKHMDQDP